MTSRTRTGWQPGDPLLDGKVAVVAGGGRGIGEATSLMLGAAGAAVAVIDVERDRAEDVTAAMRADGVTAVPLVADLRDEDDCGRVIATAVDELGRVDALANVAGGMQQYGEWKHLEHWSTAEWDMIVQINLRYVFWLCRAVLPHMVEQGGGTIVNVTSISGVFGSPNHSAYGAAKAGLIHLTKTLAVEYGRAGIRVNAVSPGATATPANNNMEGPMRDVLGRNTPTQRPGEPDDIARTVLYFASPLSEQVTGQMLIVDGGVSAKFPLPAQGTDPSEAAAFSE